MGGAAGEETGHQAAHLLGRNLRREAHGAGGGEAGELLAGDLGLALGRAAVAKGVEQVAEAGLGVGRLQDGGHAFQAERMAAKFGQFKTMRQKKPDTVAEQGGGDRIEFQHGGEQQPLGHDCASGELGREILEHDTLLGRAAVEQKQAGGGLEEGVDGVG